MRRDDYARGFFHGAALAGLFVIVFVLCLIVGTNFARAETVNHDAKQDLPAGKSYQRICELSEADNIEIINRRSPDARIVRYEGKQARLYTYILQTGNRVDGNTGKLKWTIAGPFTKRHTGYGYRFPQPDRLYIVRQKGKSTVFPFFIVDGCVAQLLFQFPHNLHMAIAMHMRARPA
jgi:hypothetical protein